MANFTMSTIDGQHTYSSRNDTPATIVQKLKNNNKYSDTQGFLAKTQVGRYRCEMTCELDDTKANIEADLLPMLIYPVNVEVTIDRNILGLNKKSGEFIISDYVIEELGENESGDQVVKLELTQVIDT